MIKGVTIVVDDLAVLDALSRIDHVDRADAMHAIGGYLVNATQRRFERETGPDGKAWQKLAPRTAARRIGSRRRGTANILRVTNRLSNSVTYEVDASGVRVGTNVAYSAAQQLGAKIDKPARRQTIYQRYNDKTGDITGFVKRKASNFARDVDVGAHTIVIPARPYLGLDDADRLEILAILTESYGAAITGARP